MVRSAFADAVALDADGYILADMDCKTSAAGIFAAMTAVLAHAIQAFGYPICSTINALAWVLGLRALWMAFIYPLYPTYSCLIQCFAVSWIMTALCNIVLLSILYGRYKKGKYKRI